LPKRLAAEFGLTPAPGAHYSGKMLTVLFPGSFDPPTNGHLDLIERCASIYKHVHVVIAVNPDKHYSFSSEERLAMMQELCAPFGNVSVHLWDRLVVEFARKVEARIMVRGVRALADFNYEFELSMLNKGLDPGIETIFMPTDPRYFVLRSSAIKELARLGGDISAMVPVAISGRIIERMKR
jgi:pantetheine-phosphate adenylyltransferase